MGYLAPIHVFRRERFFTAACFPAFVENGTVADRHVKRAARARPVKRVEYSGTLVALDQSDERQALSRAQNSGRKIACKRKMVRQRAATDLEKINKGVLGDAIPGDFN